MTSYLRSDIDAAMKRDPAARSRFEVFLCYPGIKAIASHRIAHWLYNKKFRFVARLISQMSRFFTGIEIHPGAKIGRGFFIDHGMGVVIGETCEIGDNVTLYQGVTLGGTGKDTGKRHPTIGSNVMIGAGAKVLGPFRVGDGSKIGAGAIVLKEVPPGCTVVGNPGHIIKCTEQEAQRVCVDMDQIHLPDPIENELEQLRCQLRELQEKIHVANQGGSK